MASESRSDEDLVRAVSTGLAADVLSEDYPMDEVDRELREAGGDPVELARWGTGLVKELARKRRLAWQSEAMKVRDLMQSKLAARTPIARLPRAELIARIEAARNDPRLTAPVAIAARNLKGEVTDDELRQLAEDLEALAILADEKGGGGDDHT